MDLEKLSESIKTLSAHVTKILDDVPDNTKIILILAGVFFFMAAGYGLVVFLYSRQILTIPVPWDKKGPRSFYYNKPPGSMFDKKNPDYLADSLGYFNSGLPGREVRVTATVRATINHGRISDCCKGNCGGLTGIGMQLEGIIPASLDNNTKKLYIITVQ